VVDLVPTLAAILGIPAPSVDGVDRSLLLRKVPGYRQIPAYVTTPST
jgi:hypothetical protein